MSILLIEILTFCLIVAATFVASRELGRILNQRRRLNPRERGGKLVASPLLNRRTVSNSFFNWVQSASSLKNDEERQKLVRELFLAGFKAPTAAIIFVLSRFSLAIILPFLFIIGRSLLSRSEMTFGGIFITLMLCVVGYTAPAKFVSWRAAARRAELEYEFPDALDLMVVCVEAGLSLDATFVRVGAELRGSYPHVSREFTRMAEEMRAGRGRAEALRAMADRTDVGAIKSFVALIIQSDALGASIAQTLRTYSNEMREVRFLKAEERAMRIPVLMTVPLVACILPVIVTALLLPAMIDVMRNFLPALIHH